MKLFNFEANGVHILCRANIKLLVSYTIILMLISENIKHLKLLNRVHSHMMNEAVVETVWLKSPSFEHSTKFNSDATNVDPNIDPKSGNRQPEDISPDFFLPPKEIRKLLTTVTCFLSLILGTMFIISVFISNGAQDECICSGPKCHSVLHHSADSIFWSFGI